MAEFIHRLVRLPEVVSFCGLKPTQIYAHIKAGEFPKPIKLTDSGRAIAWDEAELLAWREQRIAARQKAETCGRPS